MELAFNSINTQLRHEAAWDNPEALIILDKRRIEGVGVGGIGGTIHLHFMELSIYTSRNYPFNYPRKEHTRCIFKWFTLQFKHYLQRWRVRYLSALKFMGTVCCL